MRKFFPVRPRRRPSPPILELLPPPALGDRRHRGLARRGIAVRWCAVFVMLARERPHPRLAYRRGSGPALCLERSRHAPARWRRGEVKLDRLAAGTRARLAAQFPAARPNTHPPPPLAPLPAD